MVNLDLEGFGTALSEIFDDTRESVDKCYTYLMHHYVEYGVEGRALERIITYSGLRLRSIRINKGMPLTKLYTARLAKKIDFILGKMSGLELDGAMLNLDIAHPEDSYSELDDILKYEVSDDIMIAEYKRLFKFEGVYGIIARGEPITEEMLKA